MSYGKMPILLVLIIVSVVFVSGQSSVEKNFVEIPEEDSVSYKGYEFGFDRYENSGYILNVENPQGVLQGQYTGDDFFSIVGSWINVTDSLGFKPVSIDREDSELEGRVSAPERFFGESEINFTAPNYIVKEAGESFTVPMEVSNEGGIEEDYELEAGGKSSVSVDFQHKGYNITKLEVEPGETKTANTEIDLDEDMTNGLYSINFSVYDESFSSKNFSFQVINSSDEDRSLSMRLEQSYVEKGAGEGISSEFRVRNLGEENVEDVKPEISVPDNWNYSVSPEEAENISSDEFQDFSLEVGVPSTASSGDYFVDVGLGNTEDFDKKNFRVNVSSQSSGLGIFGIVLALLAIVLVGGVYKVFGRR